jgi:ATP-binding cassette subfamily C protein CydC
MKRGAVMARLWALLRGERRRMLLATLLGLATVMAGVGLLMTSAWLISTAALHPSIAAIAVAVTGVRFFGITRGIFRYLERLVAHEVTFRLLARLRVWFFRAVEPLAPARLAGTRSGDLLTRVVADVENLEHVYVRLLAPPAVALLTAALCAWLFGRWDARLAWALFGSLFAGGVVLPLMMQLAGKRIGARLVAVRAELNIAAVDAVQGLADLLVYGRAAAQQGKIGALNAEWTRLQRRLTALNGLGEALLGLCQAAAVVALFALAAPLVTHGALAGVLLAVLTLGVMACFEAVAPLPQAFQSWEQQRQAARRVFAVADEAPAVMPPAKPLPLPATHELEFDRVAFRYSPDDEFVLRDFSLKIPAGGRVTILGPSGVGKSTLASLLVRFWDVSAGAIRLGGCDLRELQPHDLPSVIGVVPQQPWLMGATLRENLLLAKHDATDAELLRVLAAVKLDQFVESLPEKLDTWLGDQGLRLSGGQRRRLALAQALLRATPVMVFDEPTADLDPVTEREIMALIWSLDARHTVIVITHREVALDRAGQIVRLA